MGNYIGDNINAIRMHRGLSQRELADMAGVSQTTVSAWECGSTIPRRSNIARIIEALPGLEEDDVYSESLGFARRMAHECGDAAFSDIPLHGSISAGVPIEMLPVDEMHPLPRALRDRYPESFYLKVRGESMNRILPNGSYALVDPSADVVAGRVYAVTVGGNEATIKRVRPLNNGIELVPDSIDPTFKSAAFDYADPTAQTVSLIGRVVWCTIPYDFDI